MTDNKPSDKASILGELETLNALLRDEDGIPILQDTVTFDPPVAASDSDAVDTPSEANADIDSPIHLPDPDLEAARQSLDQVYRAYSAEMDASTPATSQLTPASPGPAPIQPQAQNQLDIFGTAGDTPATDLRPEASNTKPDSSNTLGSKDSNFIAPVNQSAADKAAVAKTIGADSDPSSLPANSDHRLLDPKKVTLDTLGEFLTGQPATTDYTEVTPDRVMPAPAVTANPSQPVSRSSQSKDSSKSAVRIDPHTTKARGENPFLPKHIRDRLHTNKALVDIINESRNELQPRPETTQPATSKSATSHEAASGDPIQKLIDQIVRDYMPHLEADLRQRLQQLIRTGKLTIDPNYNLGRDATGNPAQNATGPEDN